MSKLKSQTDLSGVLGEEVKIRKVAGRVVVTNRPRRAAGPPTDKQEEVQSRFTQAANYANWQMSIPEAKADYETKITKRLSSAFVVAVSDFLNAPVVKAINTQQYKGAVGNVISINAVDDFRVTKVLVTILAVDGSEIENGNAIEHPSKYWEYTATVANPQLVGTTIRVIAYDKPGNQTVAEMKL